MFKFLSSGLDITEVCRHSNNRKKAAKNCQDASTELFFSALIRDRPVTTMGIVSKIENDNVYVYLPDYALDKTFSLKNLPVVKYVVTKPKKNQRRDPAATPAPAPAPSVTIFWAKDPSWTPPKPSDKG